MRFACLAVSTLQHFIRESLPLAAFLRELFESIELPIPCQAESLLTDSIPLKGVAQRINSQRATGKMPEPMWAHGRSSSGSCNGLFSEGFPTGIEDLIRAHPILRTGLPFPRCGQDPKAHWEAPLLICNFQRVAQATLCCKRVVSSGVHRIATALQLFENSNEQVRTQARRAVESA
jgi:hypothetical protein